jgi:hypothetical protein
MIDETLTKFIKQSTQQKGKRRNKERRPQFEPKEQKPKRATKGQGIIMFESPQHLQETF